MEKKKGREREREREREEEGKKGRRKMVKPKLANYCYVQ